MSGLCEEKQKKHINTMWRSNGSYWELRQVLKLVTKFESLCAHGMLRSLTFQNAKCVTFVTRAVGYQISINIIVYIYSLI